MTIRLYNLPNKIIAITGGIASGKTTYCKQLEAEGKLVFYLDEISRRTWKSRAMSNAFVANGYDTNLIGNRHAVRKKAFEEPAFLAFLEETIGDLFEGEFSKEYIAKRAWEHDTIYFEDAMLPKRGNKHLFDEIILIDAPEEERLKRIITRDGCSEATARAMIDVQRGLYDGL